MESIFVAFADRAGLLVEVAAVLIVAFGSAEAFARLVRTAWARDATHGQRKDLERAGAAGESDTPARVARVTG